MKDQNEQVIAQPAPSLGGDPSPHLLRADEERRARKIFAAFSRSRR
jgi:hypothetical protein